MNDSQVILIYFEEDGDMIKEFFSSLEEVNEYVVDEEIEEFEITHLNGKLIRAESPTRGNKKELD